MCTEFRITIEGNDEAVIVPAPLGLIAPLLRDMAGQFAEKGAADGYIAVPIPQDADLIREDVAAMFDALCPGLYVAYLYYDGCAPDTGTTPMSDKFYVDYVDNIIDTWTIA